MIGQLFGNYRVVAKIGEGGMGAVYRAEHTLIGKPAALKVLLAEYSQNRRIVTRFFNEAKATSAIQHRSIVEILDFGYSHGGNAYLLMEFLDGESLASRMGHTPVLPLEMALRLIRQVAGALSAAHNSDIVHRDLKPDNIFIVSDTEVPGGERIKLLDFGIAKLTENQPSEVKTRTGALMGTPAYMAPEQCKGAGEVDHRVDLYAVGCMLFEMLCGRRPFVADGSGEILAQHIFMPPPTPSSIQPSITPDIDAFILRLLAKQPDQRIASADQVIAEIDALARARSMYEIQTRPGTVPRLPSSSSPPATIAPKLDGDAYDNTTLGASAIAHTVSAHTAGAGRRRLRLLVPLAALSVALAVGGVFAWRAQVNGSENHTGALDVDGTTHAPATSDVIEPAPTPTEVPSTYAIRIESTPTGADIHGIGDRVVKTPFDLALPDGETVDIRVLKDGFTEQQLTLPDAAVDGNLMVALRPTAPEKKKKKTTTTTKKKTTTTKKKTTTKTKPPRKKDTIEKGQTIDEW